MIIEQTIEIPVDRRITLDVPREVPVGRAILIFKPLAGEPVRLTAQEAKDRGLGFGVGPRIDPMEAIKRCSGITKRLGFILSSDDFLAMGRQDKEFEDRLDSLEERQQD